MQGVDRTIDASFLLLTDCPVCLDTPKMVTRGQLRIRYATGAVSNRISLRNLNLGDEYGIIVCPRPASLSKSIPRQLCNSDLMQKFLLSHYLSYKSLLEHSLPTLFMAVVPSNLPTPLTTETKRIHGSSQAPICETALCPSPRHGRRPLDFSFAISIPS